MKIFGNKESATESLQMKVWIKFENGHQLINYTSVPSGLNQRFYALMAYGIVHTELLHLDKDFQIHDPMKYAAYMEIPGQGKILL